jgi:hypothetical protein
MKQTIKNRGNGLIRFRTLTIWSIIIFGLLSLLTLRAAAQDPTPIPTATLAPTWTPEAGVTPSPTAGVPVGPTPPSSGPTSTPEGRVLNFRTDNDEIDLGECVLFSWVVRGDVAWVEFNEVDNDEDAFLVEDQGERQECPDNDTDYELIVTWLDGSRSKDSIEIEVNGSGISSGGSGEGGGSAPTPGPFVVVTPIAYSEVQGEVTPIPGFMNIPDSASLPPDNAILASIVQLPETGSRPAGASLTHRIVPSVANVPINAPESGGGISWPARSVVPAILIVALAAGLVVLSKFSQQSP